MHFSYLMCNFFIRQPFPLVQETSKSESLPDALEVVSLPVGIGCVVLVGGNERLLQLKHSMVFLLLKLNLNVREVTGRPLFVPPSLHNFFTRNNFSELSADVAAE